MDIHKNARTTPLSRMLIVQRLASGWAVTAVAAAHGISAKTVRKWTPRKTSGGAAFGMILYRLLGGVGGDGAARVF
jgi:transposase-like protein